MDRSFTIVGRIDPIAFIREGLPDVYERLEPNPDDGAYMLYGKFGEYLYSLPADDPQWSRICKFLSSMAASGDSDLETLLVVEVFENLPKEHPATRRLSTELAGESLRLWREYQEWEDPEKIRSVEESRRK